MAVYLAHGLLMMIGWGLLLPAGAIIARFCKHRPNGLWFKLHRGIQIFGLLLTIIGWIIALTYFDGFGGGEGFVSYEHGICGMVVMILGCLQPFNAFIRPHAPEDPAEDKTTLRTTWEVIHKGSGWFAVLLAIPTIALGSLSLPYSVDDKNTFQITYGACWGCLLVLIAYICYDKKTYVKEEVEEVAAL
jgi:hypothetical protein